MREIIAPSNTAWSSAMPVLMMRPMPTEGVVFGGIVFLNSARERVFGRVGPDVRDAPKLARTLIGHDDRACVGDRRDRHRRELAKRLGEGRATSIATLSSHERGTPNDDGPRGRSRSNRRDGGQAERDDDP